mmetsp:Transcript_133836/g.232226  ORF Transcript_133836/g.232226 Transcript_133836/m.232226 type:complete len:291 (+) Transcript_133836:1129-2001(+)
MFRFPRLSQGLWASTRAVLAAVLCPLWYLIGTVHCLLRDFRFGAAWLHLHFGAAWLHLHSRSSLHERREGEDRLWGHTGVYGLGVSCRGQGGRLRYRHQLGHLGYGGQHLLAGLALLSRRTARLSRRTARAHQGLCFLLFALALQVLHCPLVLSQSVVISAIKVVHVRANILAPFAPYFAQLLQIIIIQLRILQHCQGLVVTDLLQRLPDDGIALHLLLQGSVDVLEGIYNVLPVVHASLLVLCGEILECTQEVPHLALGFTNDAPAKVGSLPFRPITLGPKVSFKTQLL